MAFAELSSAFCCFLCSRLVCVYVYILPSIIVDAPDSISSNVSHHANPFLHRIVYTAGQVTCTSGSLYASNFTGADVYTASITTAAQLNSELSNSVSNTTTKILIIAAGSYTLSAGYTLAPNICLQVSLDFFLQ